MLWEKKKKDKSKEIKPLPFYSLIVENGEGNLITNSSQKRIYDSILVVGKNRVRKGRNVVAYKNGWYRIGKEVPCYHNSELTAYNKHIYFWNKSDKGRKNTVAV